MIIKIIFKKDCKLIGINETPQYIYVVNDAVQFDDTFNNIEQSTINSNLGNNVQERWINYQNIYNNENN